MTESLNTIAGERPAMPIAIVGLSALFPGASTAQDFWRNIVRGHDSITDVPESHWRLEDYFDPDPSVPDKTYAARAGFLPETPFNPIEFGLPPTQLDVTDILQLLSLTVARDLIADSGYEKRDMPKERTGAIFGITGANSLTQPLSNRLQGPVWRKVLSSRGYSDEQIDDLIETMKKAYAPWEENSFPGMLGNVVAGRVANRFDLGGTNCTIDAACASSLAAMRMAIDELQTGRADMMLTGGCDAENTILMFMCFSKTPAFSRKGAITPFDVDADGTMIGEGIGMMMLKRLDDAERDNDRIYAVIKGLGSSSDGRFKSIYAPRAQGQVRALKRAYEEADISPARVGLIEAHGTGTAVGDATEAEGLRLLFEQTGTSTDAKRTALGSVKSQIGHTKAAAGAASAIKAALALHHRVLPPTINVKKPDPKLGLDDTPLYINTEARPWFCAPGERRVAGVSSFGFGGTNFHMVMEEAPKRKTDARFDLTPRPILVSAETPDDLVARCRTLIELSGPKAWPFETDIASSMPRVAFAADDDGERVEQLKRAIALITKSPDATELRHPKGIFYRREAVVGKVAALFAGQGAQHPDMGRSSMNALPQMRKFIEAMDPWFVKYGDTPLSEIMYPTPAFDPKVGQTQSKAIRRTRYAQAAIGALSAAQLSLFKAAGFDFDMAGGHSFGELTALWSAGVMDDETYVRLAKLRGEAMTPPKVDGFDPGTMTAVAASETEITPMISDSGAEVQICNINAPRQTVVGGSQFGISVFEKFLSDNSIGFTRLPVSGAFHTPRVAHAITAFSKAINAETLTATGTPVYANRDGAPYGDDVASQLKAQLSEPVRFMAMIERMYCDGARVFVEFGPKDGLSGIVSKILGDRPHCTVSVDKGDPALSARRLIEAAAEIAAAGCPMRDLLPGRPPICEPVSAKKGTVTLTGVNHVSAARQKAFEAALASPPRALPVMRSENRAPVAEQAAQTPDISTAQPAKATMQPTNTNSTAALVQELSQALNQTHGAFLAGQNDALSKTLGFRGDPTRLRTAERIRSETLKTHEAFLTSVNALAVRITAAPEPEEAPARTKDSTAEIAVFPRSFREPADQSALVPMPPEVDETPPVAPKVVPNADNDAAALLIAIVAEKTGYPADVLELDMDMEADLGIDSIKRVEILGALREQNPDGMSEPDPEVFGTLRTLRDVAALAGGIAEKAPNVASTSETKTGAGSGTPTSEPVSIEQARDDTPAAAATLIAIVAEKTGYPEDVLELDMDMEADLGIDSIKRVEILGALREQTPEGMPEPDPEVFGTLRTLRDVAAFASGLVQSPPMVAPEPAPALERSVPEPAIMPPASDETPTAAAMLIAIVAEKTGYPEDVLELDMDMEADLGIDSIKRVEILGALREQNPSGMPEPDPEVFGTLRTLRDVAALASGIPEAAPTVAPEPAIALAVAQDPSLLSPDGSQTHDTAPAAAALLIAIVAEMTGYPEDVLELDMDMEADLGIDSIKRVEILGALREQTPNGMPEPDPEVFGTLRTLRDVAALASGIAEEATNLPGKPERSPESPVAVSTGVGRADIRVVQARPRLTSVLQRATVLIFGDADLGGVLAARFRSDGHDAISIVTVEDAQRLLGERSWDGVILLRPSCDGGLPENRDAESARVTADMLVVASAAKPMLEKVGDGAFFMAATRMDGALGYGDTTEDVTAGALAGLLKTFAAESPTTRCRHVDVAPDLDAVDAAELIWQEVADHDRSTLEIGVSPTMRLTTEVRATFEALRSHAPDEGETFVVTGGGLGVTALCIRELARRAPRNLLLIGRSRLLAADPDWAKGISDDASLKAAAAGHLKATAKPTPRAIFAAIKDIQASRSIRDLLTDLRDDGSTVDYVSADLSDPASLQRVAAHEIVAQAQTLSVVHGAGALADAMLERKTPEDMHRVFAPKVYGLAALLRALPTDRLKRLWLFSSVAGLFGNIGQSDYAMANEVLNRVAAHWRKKGVDARALNWGAWDAGMVDDRVRAVFEERGIELIPPQQGSKLFADEFLRDPPENGLCMIGSLRPLSTRIASPSVFRNLHSVGVDWREPMALPLLQHHRIKGRAVLPATFALGLVAAELERTVPGWFFIGARRFSILNGVGTDEHDPTAFTMRVDPIDVGNDAVRATIRITDEAGRPRFALEGADFRLAAEKADLSGVVSDTGGAPMDARDFYADGPLFHGPKLRLLSSYKVDPQRAQCSFALTPVDAIAPVASARFDPILGDAMLQAALAATFLLSDLPSLPARLDELRLGNKPSNRARVTVHLVLDGETGTEARWRIAAREGAETLISLTATTIKSASLASRFAISAE